MATTLIDWRPSALSAVCPSIVPFNDTLLETQIHVVALPAVPTVVWTEPTFGLGYAAVERSGAEALGATKINNSIGTPAAMPATGATTSSVIAVATDDLRNQQQADKVKGADARGIPPRGRRRV